MESEYACKTEAVSVENSRENATNLCLVMF